MIKAIIFDCFGVLVESSLESFHGDYLHDDPNKLKLSEEKMQESNRGEITYEEYVQFLADLAGVDYEEAYSVLDNNPKNVQLLEYIATELKPNYKIGFLSNASDDWLDELFAKEDLELFDALVLSYQTGYAKPEAVIYEIAADKLGVRLDECVFIDDRQDYVDGAKAVGMKTIIYKNFDQFKSEIFRVLS